MISVHLVRAWKKGEQSADKAVSHYVLLCVVVCYRMLSCSRGHHSAILACILTANAHFVLFLFCPCFSWPAQPQSTIARYHILSHALTHSLKDTNTCLVGTGTLNKHSHHHQHHTPSYIIIYHHTTITHHHACLYSLAAFDD